MRHTFHSEQWLPYPVELVFPFFANPENLPRLMSSWQKARFEDAALVAPPSTPFVAGSRLRAKVIAAGAGTTSPSASALSPRTLPRFLGGQDL
jgi:ligand-binding SRPBCC domain-containing protein